MTVLKDWLLGVVAAALAVALAQAVTPEGTVKRVGRLAGGLVLTLAILRPLPYLGTASLSLPAFQTEGEEAADPGTEPLKILIAQKAGAYIVDKGAQAGLSCTVAVTVAEDESGWPVPWSAEVVGEHFTGEQKAALSRAMEELDIPRERQSFRKEVP